LAEIGDAEAGGGTAGGVTVAQGATTGWVVAPAVAFG